MEPAILAAAVLVLVVAAILLWRWQRRAASPARARVADVLAAHGPARCAAAEGLLRRLAAAGDQRAIAGCLDAIEMPLLQAIPDCPPSLKSGLVDALDACARCCADRGVAKRLVDLRNALLSPGAG